MSEKLSNCPCGSGLPYETCCEPYIAGSKTPATAEILMRSRYTAYAKSAIDYLYRTSGKEVQKEFDAEQTRKWAESAQWSGIEIIKTSKGTEKDDVGEVEFVAHYKVNDADYIHHELSYFHKSDGEWKFTDGKIFGPRPFRHETPKMGRNDPCPCGSGKKYKKCCYGKA